MAAYVLSKFRTVRALNSEIHLGKMARVNNGRAKSGILSARRAALLSKVYQWFGPRRSLKNAPSHSAQPSPNFFRGMKSAKYGLDELSFRNEGTYRKSTTEWERR